MSRAELNARQPIDLVVTDHLDGNRSGVARFNELLAARLAVPVTSVSDPRTAAAAIPLLSFKFSELSQDERASIDRVVSRDGCTCEVFLHELSGEELETRAIGRARRVYCGNLEILDALRVSGIEAESAWTPGLLQDDRRFLPAETSIFSFGMAHKIRTDMFRRLRELLDASGRSYVVYVSAATHETASLRDAEVVFEEMHEIFPDELFFLGNLSDVAVANFLREATFFAAFFGGGVRGNNTSVSSAMERGARVITNLDRFSPPEFVHMDNVIDVTRCEALPSDPLDLARISVRAIETGRVRSWSHLIEQLQRGP
jgi:hypothetical protein